MRIILQLAPATGWRAAYTDEADGISLAPVALWALVQDDEGNRYVEGIEADDIVAFCSDTEGCLGYVAEECPAGLRLVGSDDCRHMSIDAGALGIDATVECPVSS